MLRSRQERGLLAKLASGALDGFVGNGLTTSGGSTIWTEIKDGIPVRYKKGPGGKLFDLRENERFGGTLHTLQTWRTDDEKLGFLRELGWLIDDVDVKGYSARFKRRN